MRQFGRWGGALLLAALLFAFAATAALAAGAEVAVQTKFDQLMAGLAKGDRDSFLKDGSAEFKNEMTLERFDQVAKMFAAEAQNGFSNTYFGSLNQKGYVLHLWKLTFKGSDTDVLATMVLKGGTIEAFWLE